MKLIDGAVTQRERPGDKLGNMAIQGHHHLINVRGGCQPRGDGAELTHYLHRIWIVPAAMAGAVLLLFAAFFRASDRAAARAHSRAMTSAT